MVVHATPIKGLAKSGLVMVGNKRMAYTRYKHCSLFMQLDKQQPHLLPYSIPSTHASKLPTHTKPFKGLSEIALKHFVRTLPTCELFRKDRSLPFFQPCTHSMSVPLNIMMA